jgi:hypothetical protein
MVGIVRRTRNDEVKPEGALAPEVGLRPGLWYTQATMYRR